MSCRAWRCMAFNGMTRVIASIALHGVQRHDTCHGVHRVHGVQRRVMIIYICHHNMHGVHGVHAVQRVQRRAMALVPLYSTCTRTLTFQNVCLRRRWTQPEQSTLAHSSLLLAPVCVWVCVGGWMGGKRKRVCRTCANTTYVKEYGEHTIP